MRFRIAACIVVAAVALVPTPVTAGSHGQPARVVSYPGGFATGVSVSESLRFGGYVSPVTPVVIGDGLTYHNLDIAMHDVVSFAYGSDFSGWCWLDPDNPDNDVDNPAHRAYPKGRCPLFVSELITTGEETPVLGIENITPGQVYQFYCTLHTFMRGYVVGVEGP